MKFEGSMVINPVALLLGTTGVQDLRYFEKEAQDQWGWTDWSKNINSVLREFLLL